jgi:uncharacterized membrane protein (DUF4010 family)
MNEYDTLLRLGLALAIGFVFGLERGWQERGEEEGHRTAGLRTFTLIGLLGGILAELSITAGGIVLGIGFAATAIVMGAFMMREGMQQGNFSATSLVASMLAFSLGAYAVLGNPALAAGSAVAAVFFLAYKRLLHGWLQRLTWEELRAGLLLGAMTFIALPLLPNRTIDPWGAINPYELWVMTVLIAALSFAGYAAIRLIGPERGTVVAAAAGGLVSSTAVTLSLARMAVSNPGRAGLLAGSILVAGIVMQGRVLVITGLVYPPLAMSLALPLVTASVVMTGVAAFLIYREKQNGGDDIAFGLKNPFELGMVLRFGALLAIVMLLVFVVRKQFGGGGLLALGALSGLADVDALTLSVARLNDVSETAVDAILLAVAVNTIAKAIYAWSAGGGKLGLRVMIGSVAAILAGTAALFVPVI